MSKTEADAVAMTPADQPLEKLFYSIGEVSEMTGVEPYVLRYWEVEFKPLHPSKRSSGQRTYQKKDIETVLTIRKLLYEDLYTIAGARKRLQEGTTHDSPIAAVEQVALPAPEPVIIERIQKDEESLNLLKEIRSELQDLQEVLRNL